MLKGTNRLQQVQVCVISQVWDGVLLMLPSVRRHLSLRSAGYDTLKHQGTRCSLSHSNENFLTVVNLSFKQLRRIQNQHAYKRRKDLSASKLHEVSASKPLPSIPEKLTEDALFHLPKSRLFLQAAEDILEGSDYGDDQLAHWDQAPPYAVQGDIEIIGLVEDAQHGRRHRIQREYEESQLKDYKTKPADIVSSEVYHEILKSLRKWEEADCALVGLQNPFDIRMGEHWKKWQARRVVSLQQDWEALQEGSDRFLCVYVDRWS